LEAIQRRARKNRTSVSWFLDNFDLATAGNVVIGKSAAIVFVNSDSGEEYITVDGNEGDRYVKCVATASLLLKHVSDVSEKI
jgi:hypothetical protein